jgi:sugar/nucleoside kinase (ribokinase family)
MPCSQPRSPSNWLSSNVADADARSPRVLVIGDVMIDIAAMLEGPIAVGSDRRATIVQRPGGSAATQAVWLARFGIGVDFVGRVGAADHAAETALLRHAGVEPHLSADPVLETGRLIAIVDPAGERSFLTDRGANDGLVAADISDALIARADHIHLSGYSFLAPSPREAASSVMDRAPCPVSIDPGSAEFLREVGAENFLAWTAGAAMLFPNSEEAAVLAGTDDIEAQGERLAARYPLVVIKRGAAGCEARRGAERWRIAAPVAAVVDTTGAGDAFVAAFLAAILSREAIEESLRRAVAAGSAATAYVGGRPH